MTTHKPLEMMSMEEEAATAVNGYEHNKDTECAPPDEPTTPAPTEKPAKVHPLCTAITILFWYLISNGIILTTKWLFSNYFPYPLTVTTYSNGVAFLWALLASTMIPTQRVTKEMFWSFVVPIGLTTALEIGSSNLALKLLTVSFGTILKGGGPIFTFLWGLCFGLEQFSCRIGTSLLFIAVGIALASLGEGQEFELLGFILQLLASALGGLRWAMTHKLLKDGAGGGGGHQKPMSALTAILYTSPMTSLCVMPFALALEADAIFWGGTDALNHIDDATDDDDGLTTALHNNTQQLLEVADSTDAVTTASGGDIAVILATMTCIATLVFILLMSEYWLVKATSSLALSVAGVFKELLTIGGGIFFFSESIDLLNVVGFFTCQLGIMSYVCMRFDNDSEASYMPVTPPSSQQPPQQHHQGDVYLDEEQQNEDDLTDEERQEVELHTFTID